VKALPKHHCYWNQEISHVGHKNISFRVAGVEITPCGGDFLNVFDHLRQSGDHENNEETGRYESDIDLYRASLRPQTRYVEPLLSFGECLSRFWPIYLSRHIETIIRVEQQPLPMWYQSTDQSIPWLLQADKELGQCDIKMKCYADVYVLNTTELEDRYARPRKEFLVLQNQSLVQEVGPTTTDTPVVIDLNFRNPCTEFAFTAQEKANLDKKEFTNYWYKGGDSIREAKLTVDGADVYGWRKAPFWRTVTTKNYSKKPTRPIYVIPNCFFPEKPELPSGFRDCSATKVQLHIRLPIGMDTCIIKVHSRGYNKMDLTRQPNGRHTAALADRLQS
jgi:hypothetical protein